MAFTITVNNDDNHSLTFSKNTLARRNEANVSVTVVVPAAVYALGSFAYIDFILPDGSTYFKGDYDPSSGSFTFTLGSSDTILSQDGRIGIQFVLRDSDVLPTVVWKSELKYALVGSSADATAQALTGIPAPATFPSTFPAANTSIVDAGGYYASPDVEDALQEIGLTNNTQDSNIANIITTNNTQDSNIANIITAGVANPFTNMPYVGTAPVVESGSNANGSYIKFADGTMICTGRKNFANVTITTAWGSVFSSGVFNLSFDDFPVAFISAPQVTWTPGLSASSSDYWIMSQNTFQATATNPGRCQLLRGTSNTINLSLAYTAIGRWKA